MASVHISGQLIRSATSPALHYGEVRAAESDKDFLHKLKVVLKELRESWAALELIRRSELTRNGVKVDALIKECDELISIFVTSTKTASTPKSSRKSKNDAE
jgi:four helix bundle protein